MKYSLIFATILPFFSCNNDVQDIVDKHQSDTRLIRTTEEAANCAVDFMEGRLLSRGGIYNVVSVDIVNSEKSRMVSDTLIYAVNFEEGKGYCLVSAARRGVDIIAYSDCNSFEKEQVSTNPALEFYLDAAKRYVSNNLTNSEIIVKPERPVTVKRTISPRISVEWGQGYPEGFLCPNKISGCVQTATAQIMSYFKFPAAVQLTYSDRDKEVQSLDWNEMIKHKKSVSLNTAYSKSLHLDKCEATEDTHMAIARLCRELAERNDADFEVSGTAVIDYDGYTTLKGLLTACDFTEFTYFNSSYSNLFEGLYGKSAVAYVVGSSSSGRHAWVCDGGENIRTTTKYTLIGGEIQTIVEDTYYYHFNWGYCGKYNDYFLAGVFDTDNPASRYDFNSNLSFYVVSK